MEKRSNVRNKKGGFGIDSEMIAYFVIGLAVLAAVGIGYLILSGKLTGAGNFIKNLFKFGG